MHIHPFGYPILSTHRRLLRHAWQQDRALFSYCFLYTLAAAFYPFLAVLVPRYLLAELTRPAGARIQALLHHSDRVFLVIQCPWLRPTHHPRTLQIPFYSAAFELYRGSMP